MVLPTGYRPEKGVYRPDDRAKRSKKEQNQKCNRIDTICT